MQQCDLREFHLKWWGQGIEVEEEKKVCPFGGGQGSLGLETINQYINFDPFG